MGLAGIGMITFIYKVPALTGVDNAANTTIYMYDNVSNKNVSNNNTRIIKALLLRIMFIVYPKESFDKFHQAIYRWVSAKLR